MKLSKFFTLAEMTRSDTAVRHGISNLPDDAATGHLKALCLAVLDPLREAVQSSITVSSGYRGPALNARIGGAKRSQHMEGKAVDIQSSRVSVLDLFKNVVRLNLPYDQVIFEAKNHRTKWVHVSHDPSRARGEILVAQFNADGTSVKYRSITVQEALDLADPMPSTTRSGAPLELTFEELHDEPDLDNEPAVTVAEPEPGASTEEIDRSARKRRKGNHAPNPRRKAAPKRKTVSKRKAVSKPKAAAKRKTTARAATSTSIR